MWLPVALLTALVVVSHGSTDPIQHKAFKKCVRNNCLKLDLLRLVSRLGNMTQISLGPGITLVGTDRTQDIAVKLVPRALSPSPLVSFLEELALEYFGSLNLTLQLKESRLLDNLKGFTGGIRTGRSRKYKWYYIITVASAGFAILAALCGKALMASMLALAISALLALRSSSIGFAAAAAAAAASPSSRYTQYEIISKPVSYVSAPGHYYDEHHHHHTTGGSKHDDREYSYEKDE